MCSKIQSVYIPIYLIRHKTSKNKYNKIKNQLFSTTCISFSPLHGRPAYKINKTNKKREREREREYFIPNRFSKIVFSFYLISAVTLILSLIKNLEGYFGLHWVFAAVTGFF